MSTYRQYLMSIMTRASDAMHMHDRGELAEFAVAVGDIESDIISLMARLNKDVAVIDALETEAKKVLP